MPANTLLPPCSLGSRATPKTPAVCEHGGERIIGPCILPDGHDGQCSPVLLARHYDLAEAVLSAVLLEEVRAIHHASALHCGMVLQTVQRVRRGMR